jgi:N-acetylated-alpha-linked acidic dipeptidase
VIRPARGAVFLLAALAVSAGPTPAPTLTGFTPKRTEWQKEYEKRLLALPQPAECREIHREITRAPRIAGTDANARVAEFLAAEYRKAGWSVEMPAYEVLLSYPRSAKLAIVGEPDVALARGEPPIDSDPDTDVPEAALPWNAYSPSAEVVAPVVYVNRGSAEDYEKLAGMGIDVRGKIALARYFGGYRGGKALEAEKRGAAAILVYSDPIDDGWFQGRVYPDGPWGPPSHFQRGSNVYDFIVPGDPLTPGWASIPDARRIPAAESEILPKIPMMPLSARDAAEILKRLQGPPVPGSPWQGLAVTDTYRIGPGPVRLHLKIENTRERRTIRNVIATLRGTEEPERKVLLSNHYDAWIYGGVDPSSGTASMLALGRALGQLAAEGWRPRRSIVIAAWDAEEYTLTGSTEWGEQYEHDLKQNAVLCINVDASALGKRFAASASPLLFTALREAARDFPDPEAPGRTLADAWTQNREPAGGPEPLPVAILGSGSDYTVFFNHLGIPSTDLVFDGPYGVYHSVYDTHRWMETQGDPGFVYHAAMAKYAGMLALRFANADAFPFDAAAYGREIARYAEELQGLPPAKPLASPLSDLAALARTWSESSGAAQKSIAARVASDRTGLTAMRDANAWLLSLERALIDPPGIPGRPWCRHLVYAPLPSYEAETLPAIREAILDGRIESAGLQVQRLAGKLQSAVAAAKRAAGEPAPLPRPTARPRSAGKP